MKSRGINMHVLSLKSSETHLFFNVRDIKDLYLLEPIFASNSHFDFI